MVILLPAPSPYHDARHTTPITRETRLITILFRHRRWPLLRDRRFAWNSLRSAPAALLQLQISYI